MNSPLRKPEHEDNDLRKGATEDEAAGERTQNSMQGQLPHRGQGSLTDSFIKDNDTDYPEPGNNPEHSGQHPMNADAIDQAEEPSQNPDWSKEEPLAS